MSNLAKRFKIPILLLILLDQFIKIYIINNNLMDKNFYIFYDIVEFVPTLNTSYSWFNSKFNLGIGLWFHIIVTIVILIFSILAFYFIRDKKKENKTTNLLFIVLFAGLGCSLIDRMFWGGSLDYVHLKGLFTFDLKDVYLSVFQIMLMSCWIFNYKGLRKIDDKLLYRDFKLYIIKILNLRF